MRDKPVAQHSATTPTALCLQNTRREDGKLANVAAFAESPFWRITAAAFMPPVQTGLLPASLLERFSGDDEARLVALLRLLGPITGGGGLAHAR